MDKSMGLYDSDTGDSLTADKILPLGDDDHGEPLTLMYCTAKRGRIAQIRAGSLRIHYFLNETMIDEDADRIGRWLCMNGADAVRIIRDNATAN